VRPLSLGWHVAAATITVAVASVVITEVVIRGAVQADLALALAVPLAGAVALALALRVARPLRRLADAARLIGDGPLDEPIHVTAPGRELCELAESLSALSRALRSQRDERSATAADVRHELRGSLMGLLGGLEALADGVIEDERSALERLRGDAARVHRLVEDVVLVADGGPSAGVVRRQELDLEPVVREAVGRYAVPFRAAGITLITWTVPARIEGDADRLAQILDNLLSNALRYTDAPGLVSVRLRVESREAVIEVADSGIGICERQLGHVFERFWRAPEARVRVAEGSGVGLAVVSELVRSLGGHVGVTSRSGHGSSFRVAVPAAAPSGPPSRRRRAGRRSHRRSAWGGRIHGRPTLDGGQMRSSTRPRISELGIAPKSAES
jgi:two-component system, OmpR family, sensor histidine kinase BaeS